MMEDFHLVEIEDLKSPSNILQLCQDNGSPNIPPSFFSDHEERGSMISEHVQLADRYSQRSAPFAATTVTTNIEQETPPFGEEFNKEVKLGQSAMEDIGFRDFNEIEVLRNQLSIERRINTLQARQLANYKTSYEEMLLRIEPGEEAHTTHLEIELEKTIREQEQCERYCGVLENKNHRLKLQIQEQRAALRTIAMERRYRRGFEGNNGYVLRSPREEDMRERID